MSRWSHFKPQIIYGLLLTGLFLLAIQMQPIVTHVDIIEETVVEIEVSPIPDFAAILNVQLKKQTFFDYLQPYINQENQKISEQRAALQSIHSKAMAGGDVSDQESDLLRLLSLDYEIESTNLQSLNHVRQLLKRVDVIPSSLVLAQAANESAWGTSRFAQTGNNFFGQWCYTLGCGMVPLRRSEDATHEVRRFADVAESVHAYFMNLNTFPSYENLREIRQQLRNNNLSIDGISLTEGLSSYSERGEEYIWELQSMIYSNELLLLDNEV